MLHSMTEIADVKHATAAGTLRGCGVVDKKQGASLGSARSAGRVWRRRRNGRDAPNQDGGDRNWWRRWRLWRAKTGRR